jgi:hypothetical protein
MKYLFAKAILKSVQPSIIEVAQQLLPVYTQLCSNFLGSIKSVMATINTTKILWAVLAFFVVGNGFFLLPVNLASNNISSQHATYYKRDTLVLQSAYADTSLHLALNMAGRYQTLYDDVIAAKGKIVPKPTLEVNVVMLDDVTFMSFMFPFYKSSRFNAQISFHSNIINTEQLGIDSVALIGHIIVSGKLSVLGICTPLKAKQMIEKEMAGILEKEMTKIEADINQHLTVTYTIPVEDEPSIDELMIKKPLKRKPHLRKKKR